MLVLYDHNYSSEIRIRPWASVQGTSKSEKEIYKNTRDNRTQTAGGGRWGQTANN
jgi:hypothetical protein